VAILRAARARLRQSRDFVEQHPEPAFVLETTHHDWSVALSAGELEVSQRHIERGLALFYSQLRGVNLRLYTAHHPAVCGHGWGAQVHWLRGRPDAARQQAGEAVSLAHDLGDSVSAAFAIWMKALVYRMLREPAAALETAEAAIVEAEQMGFLYVLWSAQVVKGWALAELGRKDEGLNQVRAAIAALSPNQARLWLTMALTMLAEVCVSAGHIDEALKTVADALDLAHRSGECFWEAEIHRLNGELLYRQNLTSAEAAAAFERSLTIARCQGAKSLELRATTSLAHLLDRTNRRAEARIMLEQIYQQFTEGFDTADLKDAKALFDELA
jgi:predicted ATPase